MCVRIYSVLLHNDLSHTTNCGSMRGDSDEMQTLHNATCTLPSIVMIFIIHILELIDELEKQNHQ